MKPVVMIDNEYVLPDLVRQVVPLEVLEERFASVEIRPNGSVEVWVRGEGPRRPGRFAGVGWVYQPEPASQPEKPSRGFLDLEALEAFLQEARAQGCEAHEVWQEARRGLQREVVPARLERTSDVYGKGAAVAVIEVDGQEVDRVALEAEWETPDGAAQLEAAIQNPPASVWGYPYGSEETRRIMEVLNRHCWTDLEDYRGHVLGALVVMEWK